MRIELGDRVRDKISGLQGIVVGDTKWLYGCRRITVQPEKAKDNKPVEKLNLTLDKTGVLLLNAVPGKGYGDGYGAANGEGVVLGELGG